MLKDIFKHLYYPDGPYEFSVLPADILGQVYEQFLGIDKLVYELYDLSATKICGPSSGTLTPPVCSTRRSVNA